MGPTRENEDDGSDGERRSLDTELGRRLSRLSSGAKFAVTLNQIRRVEIRGVYDRQEDGGATTFVVDVFLQHVQKGLPTKTSGETKSEKKKRLRREREDERPDYQVECRYSAFRALRDHISEVVDVKDDQLHPVWCAYCCRMLWLVTYGGFPRRFPNRGPLATYTGWHRLLAHTRKGRLELFINQLLRYAKDVSYRYGGPQCERFATVSQVLSDFLTEPHLRTPRSVW